MVFAKVFARRSLGAAGWQLLRRASQVGNEAGIASFAPHGQWGALVPRADRAPFQSCLDFGLKLVEFGVVPATTSSSAGPDRRSRYRRWVVDIDDGPWFVGIEPELA